MKKENNKKYTILDTVAPYLAITTLLVVWFLATLSGSTIIPSPIDVIMKFGEVIRNGFANMTLMGHLIKSLVRILVALGFAIVWGITMGVVIGWSKKGDALVGTIFSLYRIVPPLAWLPLIIMWFGVGELSKIILVFMGTSIPIIVNTYTGVRYAEKLDVNVGKIFGASNFQLITEIAIPSALPFIFTGIKGAAGVGFMVVLAAEMLGGIGGLGFIIQKGMERFDIALIFVGMITIGLTGASIAVILQSIERWLCPWIKR